MDPYNAIFRQVQLPPTCKGRLFLTGMPGRYHDIQEALEAWNELKAEVGKERMLLLSLVDEAEIRHKSPEYAKSIHAGLWEGERISCPIPDFGTPENEKAFRELIVDVATALGSGANVVIHCGAGIGRTGMAAVCVLAAMGVPIKDATRVVRAAGSGPETPEQAAVATRLFGPR
ncbi:protein-tyrosine phosphatase family protein [Roseimicrobium gellanilyticum]|nr:tyrosine-protein phosphatase [Roseimicrobium gellanilyticum]